MPGDYTIPFTFDLPQRIPSSINIKKHDVSDEPKAKVNYTIKALLKNN